MQKANRRKTLIFLFIGIFLLSVFLPLASADVVYEYYTPTEPEAYLSTVYRDSDGVGQQFTPQISHDLSKVTLWMYRVGNPTGDATVSIYTANIGDGTPDTLLGSSSIDFDLISTSPAYVSFNFSPTIPVTAETMYCITLTGTGMDIDNKITYYLSDESTYTGGIFLWRNIDFGSDWYTSEGHALWFEEWGSGSAPTPTPSPTPSPSPSPTPEPTMTNPTGTTVYYFRSDTTTIMDELGYKMQIIDTNDIDEVYESVSSDTMNIGFRLWYYDMFNVTHEVTDGTPAGIAEVNDTESAYGDFVGYWDCPTVANVVVDHLLLVVYFEIDGDWLPEAVFLSPSGSDDIQNYMMIKNCTAEIHYTMDFYPEDTAYFAFGDNIDAPSAITLNLVRADPWSVSYARFANRDLFGAITVPWTWLIGNLFWTIMFLMVMTTIIIKHGSYKLALLLCWIMGGSGSILWAIVPESGLVVAAIMLAAGMGGTLFKIFHR